MHYSKASTLTTKADKPWHRKTSPAPTTTAQLTPQAKAKSSESTLLEVYMYSLVAQASCFIACNIEKLGKGPGYV
jgi:hypothetical protein